MIEFWRFTKDGDFYIRGERVDSIPEVCRQPKELLQRDPNQLTIQGLVEESWQCAEEKGWHTLEKSFGEECALFHSEISEALEEFRNGHGMLETYTSIDDPTRKPQGIAIELADLLIRVADTCKARGINLEGALRKKMAFNRTRSHLHGGKKL